ncbi:pyridoxal phosphate-dependent aminotransferase [Streptomyces niger]|uniref:pyridoxal phosphate-dependent aminotransferase n=1 Tax=Streptomyces niger TaxID=66373 RepID=UPI00069C4488|nr:pyridoxal phosphate-dependent aminotransferase [Streptomyces niger]
MSIAPYTIQDWLFDRAQGRFDLDLAESGVQFQLLRDLPLDPDWDLDYSLDRGTRELRERIAALYEDPGESNAASPPDRRDVVVTHGAQEALYLLYRSALAAGDHVITTAPGWQQAWEVPAHIGCEVSVLDWQPGTPFDAEALAAAVRPQTRMLILNSPCNPSGRALSDTEWDGILRVAEAHDLLVVNDEEYLLDFGASVVRRHPRSVSVSGLSKVYGMPALRVGWARGPQDVIERMVNYKRYTTVSNSVVWERVATRVLADRQRHVDRYRSLVSPGLEQLTAFAKAHDAHVELVPPHGTPFAWLRFTSVPVSSQDFAEQLLDRHRTLVMPAEVFGAEHGIRISYARPADVLAEGLRRIAEQLAASV